MKKIYRLNELNDLELDIKSPSIIFLKGDLWAWKTTLAKHIFSNLLHIKDEIKSPTYVYYNKYGNNYHFDLYRLTNSSEFFAIWWEEILDNNAWVILIEWPEIIEDRYNADIIIKLTKTDNEDEREIEIIWL